MVVESEWCGEDSGKVMPSKVQYDCDGDASGVAWWTMMPRMEKLITRWHQSGASPTG